VPRTTKSRTKSRTGRDSTVSPVELAIRWLAPRRRFEGEIRTYLRKKGIQGREIDAVLVRLKELELVDDAETSRAWIRDRLRFSPRGRELIRTELVRQGVDPDLAAVALDDTYPERSEPGFAGDVLRRAAGKFVRLAPAVARRRMWSGLARRGFGRDACRDAIAEFFEEHEMQEDELA
jgi:regulatory protein